MTGAHDSARTPLLIKPGADRTGHPLKGDVLSVRCPPLLARGQTQTCHDMSRPVRRKRPSNAMVHSQSQRPGRGQKARVALVDQVRLAGARKQLEEALGSLASFEVLTG
jgi:hypothetical protein